MATKKFSGVTLRVLKALEGAGKKGMLGKDIFKAVYAGKKKPRGNPLAPLLSRFSVDGLIGDDYNNSIAEARFKITAEAKKILAASLKK